jgi:mannose-1-phosphate guanylyltransferase/phosphomannomutase
MNEISAVIIAGGKGTRSKNPTIPKSLVEIGNQTLLSHQAQEIINFGIKKIFVVGGFLGDLVHGEIDKLNVELGQNIKFISDSEQSGTSNALQIALRHVDDDLVLVVYGDIFFKFDLDRFLTSHISKKSNCSVLVHPNNHPQDSDLVTTVPFQDRIASFREKGSVDLRENENLVCAGIFLMDRHFAKFLDFKIKDLSLAVLTLVHKKELHLSSYNTVGFLADTGTPERLRLVRQAIISGTVERRSESGKMGVFIDLDETLIENVEIKKDISFPLLDPKTCQLIGVLNRLGIPIFIVTNQPGIAKGFFDFYDLQIFKAKLDFELAEFSSFIDIWKVCPHHPDLGYPGEIAELKIQCSCRKPNIGLIKELEDSHSLDLTRCFFLGDSWRDRSLCEKLGISYIDCSHERLNSMNNFLECLVRAYDYN